MPAEEEPDLVADTATESEDNSDIATVDTEEEIEEKDPLLLESGYILMDLLRLSDRGVAASSDQSRSGLN